MNFLFLNSLLPAFPSVGPLNVISSQRRSFAERRQIQLGMLEGLIIGLIFGGVIVYFVRLLFFRGEPNADGQQILATMSQTPRGIFLIVLAVFILFVLPLLLLILANWIGDRLHDQIDLHRKGQLGEEQVLNVMYHALDGNWWLFRNLELTGRYSGDIDLVLVGLTGVWVLEVKAYSGIFRTVGDHWERLIGKRWFPAFTTPSIQAKRNAATISQVLGANSIKQWVTPAIVWANPESKLTAENPSVTIWQVHEFANALKHLQGERSIPEEQRLKIIETIKGLYQQPFISENG